MKSIFLFFVLFFLIGCGKDGEVGPQGEQGIQGEKGISGTNGSTIYSGKSAPSSSIGKSGDFFLNIANGDLYGPKINDSWGQPFNLKGPQGENGVPGATILSGVDVPPVATGKNGDFYINLKEMTMYGPKSQSGWGSPVSLKSNVENNVTVYLIQPDWNKNMVVFDNSMFGTSSEEYVIPGNKYNVISVAGATVSRGLPMNINETVWYDLSKNNLSANKSSYVFDIIVTGMDYMYSNVKIEAQLISSSSASSTYKFIVSGKQGGGLLGDNRLWIMIKSFKYTGLRADIKSVEEMNRYLRIR